MEHTIDAHGNGESGDVTIREAHASGALRCSERIVGVLSGSGRVDPQLSTTLGELCRSTRDAASPGQSSLGVLIDAEPDPPGSHAWLVPVLELAGVLGHVALIDAHVEQRLTSAFGLTDCAGLEQVAQGVTALADVMYDVEGHDRLVVIGRGSLDSVGPAIIEGPVIVDALRSAGYHVVAHVGATAASEDLDLSSDTAVLEGMDALVVLVSSTDGSAPDLDRLVDGLVTRHGLPVALIVSGLGIDTIAADPLERVSGPALTRERATRDTQDVAAAISSAWDPADLNRSTGALTAVIPDELDGLTDPR